MKRLKTISILLLTMSSLFTACLDDSGASGSWNYQAQNTNRQLMENETSNTLPTYWEFSVKDLGIVSNINYIMTTIITSDKKMEFILEKELQEVVDTVDTTADTNNEETKEEIVATKATADESKFDRSWSANITNDELKTISGLILESNIQNQTDIGDDNPPCIGTLGKIVNLSYSNEEGNEFTISGGSHYCCGGFEDTDDPLFKLLSAVDELISKYSN